MIHPIRIALFASGNGSNALALLEASQTLAGISIPLLICDQPRAPILGKLDSFDTEVALIPKEGNKSTHESAIFACLRQARIDWIFLAGYMRLLSPEFIGRWRQAHGGAPQIVNIHPSRLPAYRGLDAVARAVADGATEIGVTLHHVDEGMDTGQIIAQEAVQCRPGESLDALLPRVHALEHDLYTYFLCRIAAQDVPTQPYREPAPC